MSKTLIVYHGNCIDGFSAAWACYLRYGESAEYFPAQYGASGADVELPDVTGRDVVIVDFCTGREQLLALNARARTLLVLDHHKTAEAACAGLDFCVFDMEQSGAGLAWRHFHPTAPEPLLVSYVEDRDLWRFKLPRSKSYNAWVSTLPMNMAAWQNASEADFDGCANMGAAVLAYIDRYVLEMSAQARRVTFAGHADVPVVNAPYINTSELVGYLAKESVFAAGWFQRSDGLYQYSLRSRGDFDVSALAKRFGGGGHKNAAGFACDKLPGDL
jgi:uncharacterized protein